MTEDEAKDCIARLKNFITCNADQTEVLQQLFARYKPGMVKAAIDAYVLCEESLHFPRLRVFLEDETPRPGAYINEARIERQQHEAEEKEIERVISAISDAELERVKQVVIESLPEAAAAKGFYEKLNPRTSTMLRPLIYRYIRKSMSRSN